MDRLRVMLALELELAIAQDRCPIRWLSCWGAWRGGRSSRAKMYGKGELAKAIFALLEESPAELPRSPCRDCGKSPRASGISWSPAGVASTFPAINELRSRGVTLREIRTAAATADHPWVGRFRSDLERADLAPATVEGYLKDIRLFLHWQAREDEFPTLSEGEPITAAASRCSCACCGPMAGFWTIIGRPPCASSTTCPARSASLRSCFSIGRGVGRRRGAGETHSRLSGAREFRRERRDPPQRLDARGGSRRAQHGRVAGSGGGAAEELVRCPAGTRHA